MCYTMTVFEMLKETTTPCRAPLLRDVVPVQLLYLTAAGNRKVAGSPIEIESPFPNSKPSICNPWVPNRGASMAYRLGRFFEPKNQINQTLKRPKLQGLLTHLLFLAFVMCLTF